MKSKILTDVELRAGWRAGQEEVVVAEGTIVTPAARDFLKERNIRLRTARSGGGEMTVSPIAGGRYVEAATGRTLGEKPEAMTHLHGNVLVPKTHPRILFRGRLDSLMAQILELQCRTAEAGREELTAGLEEVLGAVRLILAAEVKEEPLAPFTLLGLDSAGLRRVSHHVKEEIGISHPIPHWSMGPLALGLNTLRTQVRETELAAAAAFMEGESCHRQDIIEALNRLSSAVYILFCRLVAEQRKD